MVGHDQHVHGCRCTQILSTYLGEMDSLGFFYDVFIMVQHDLIIHVLHTSSSRNVDNQSDNFLLPKVCCAKLTRAQAQSPRSSPLRKQ